jgi:hypothetical protein
VLPGVLQAIGLPGPRIPASQSMYPGYLQAVRHEHGSMWPVFDQFAHAAYHTLKTREGYARDFAPNFGAGGIVRARPGGTLIRVGEAGRDEAITPLGRGGGRGEQHYHFHFPNAAIVDSKTVKHAAALVAPEIARINARLS